MREIARRAGVVLGVAVTLGIAVLPLLLIVASSLGEVVEP